jgi:hypothetical protein
MEDHGPGERNLQISGASLPCIIKPGAKHAFAHTVHLNIVKANGKRVNVSIFKMQLFSLNQNSRPITILK